MANETSKPYKPHFSRGPDQLQIEHAIVLDELSDAYLKRFGPARYNELCERAIAEALARDPDPEVHLRGVRDGWLIGGPGEGKAVDSRAFGAMVSNPRERRMACQP